MAVEPMKLMSGVFLKKDASAVLKEIIIQGSLHIADKNKPSDFTIKAFERLNNNLDKDNEESISLSPFEVDHSLDSRKYKQQFLEIFDYLNIDNNPQDQKTENRPSLEELSDINDLYTEVIKLRDFEYKIDHELINLQLYVDFLQFFTENGAGDIKIKDIVVHAGRTSATHHTQSEELVMVFSPLSKTSDSKNILKSLNFTPLELPDFEENDEDTFSSLLARMEKLLSEKNKNKEDFIQKKNLFVQKNSSKIKSLYYNYKVADLSTQIEGYIAQTDHFFFIAGFIPISKIKDMERSIMEIAPETILTFEDADTVKDIAPAPTKLKNNTLFAPFETLVNMYSVPNYNEKDPTPFFAITYMLFFGMMFGDVGQGLILVLAGLLLAKKIPSLAGIASRIGVSSMIFGFLYGSVFGIENIIPSLLIRPMEEVNTILIAAICLGIVLILIAYGIGLGNLAKRKDKVNLYFDKNGITGLLFYLAFLIFIVNMIFGKRIIPQFSPILSIITAAVMIIACFILFMKPALAAKVLTAEEYKHMEKPNGVERGFELFETIMSFFTNTLSFIRVGAFAINHVGLFMAFHALGQMTGSTIGNAVMLILGNIIIIVLEGLIVAIQSIRLEYYELFSRYFKGEGVSYDPMNIKKF